MMDIGDATNRALQALQTGDCDTAERLLLDILNHCGEDAAKFANSIKDRIRLRGSEIIEREIASLHARDPNHLTVKLLDLYLYCLKLQFSKAFEADKVDVLRRIPLFRDKSEHLLSVNINIPITTCNYRCEYCFLKHDIKPDLSKLDRLGAIIERLGMIPRPLGITLTPAGEILAVPRMWAFLSQAAALPNAVWVEVWSNLSRDPELLFEHIDPAKLCLIATYHPTEFRDFEEDNEAFFARLARAQAQDVSVNFVIYEKNLPFATALRERLRDLGVHLTVNPQNNTVNGYGQPINPVSEEERALARDTADNEFIDYFYIQRRKADVRCTAGRDMIDIKADGLVTRCEHFPADSLSRELMGNILDPSGPLVDTANRLCSHGGCDCKSTLGYIETCVAKYKRVGTQHKYHRRLPGETGTHSYDPVDLKSNQVVPAMI